MQKKNVCVYGNENEHVSQYNLWLIGLFLIYIFWKTSEVYDTDESTVLDFG